MLSKTVKQKIQARFKKEVKYAKDCESLAAHISECCKCNISASTLKRLWGFIKTNNKRDTESRPRAWTLDLLAVYIGHADWSSLQDSLTGNNHKKVNKIEFIDTAILKPGIELCIKFGRTECIQIRYIGKGWFVVTNEHKTLLNIGDEIEIEKINLHLPILINKIKNSKEMNSSLIIGDITGVTEIITNESNHHKTKRQSNGILTSKK